MAGSGTGEIDFLGVVAGLGERSIDGCGPFIRRVARDVLSQCVGVNLAALSFCAADYALNGLKQLVRK